MAHAHVPALLALLLPAGADAAAIHTGSPAQGVGVSCVSHSGIHCFDAPAGDLAWRRLEGVRTLEPVATGDRVLMGSTRGLYAFDAHTGERLWYRPGAGLAFTPTVSQGTAYAGDRHGRFAAIDLATGATRWQRRFPGWSYPPAILGDVLVTGGREGVVRGLDAAAGTTRWRLELASELVYRPAATADRAIVTTFGGAVVALDARGRVAWRVDDGVASGTPAVGDGGVYLPGLDGRLRARAAADGTLLWTHDLGAPAMGPPLSAHGVLGVSTRDGTVLLLATRDGSRRSAATPDGTVVGNPVPDDDGVWHVPVHRRGTLRWQRVSH